MLNAHRGESLTKSTMASGHGTRRALCAHCVKLEWQRDALTHNMSVMNTPRTRFVARDNDDGKIVEIRSKIVEIRSKIVDHLC